MENSGNIAQPYVLPFIQIDGDYELDATAAYNIVIADISSNSVLTLPDVNRVINGYYVWIKRKDNNPCELCILTSSDQLIDNETFIILSNNEEMKLMCGGKSWCVVVGGNNFVTSCRDLSTSAPVKGGFVYNTNEDFGSGVGYYVSDGIGWFELTEVGAITTIGMLKGNGSVTNPVTLMDANDGNLIQWNDGWNLSQSLTSNTIYVDSSYGNDLSGKKDNPLAAFSTLAGAVNYIISNSLTGYNVHVRKGLYKCECNLIILETNWFFESETYIACFKTPFQIGTANCSVYGYGNFIIDGCQFINDFDGIGSVLTVKINSLSVAMPNEYSICYVKNNAVNVTIENVNVTNRNNISVFLLGSQNNQVSIGTATLDGNDIKLFNLSDSSVNTTLSLKKINGNGKTIFDNSDSNVNFNGECSTVTIMGSNGVFNGNFGSTLTVNVIGSKFVNINANLIETVNINSANSNVNMASNQIGIKYNVNSIIFAMSMTGTVNIRTNLLIGAINNQSVNIFTANFNIGTHTISTLPALTTNRGNINYEVQSIDPFNVGALFVNSGDTNVTIKSRYNDEGSLLIALCLGGNLIINCPSISCSTTFAKIHGGGLELNVPTLSSNRDCIEFISVAGSYLNMNSVKAKTHNINAHILNIKSGAGGIIRLQNCVFASSTNAIKSDTPFNIYVYHSLIVSTASLNINHLIGSEIITKII